MVFETKDPFGSPEEFGNRQQHRWTLGRRIDSYHASYESYVANICRTDEETSQPERTGTRPRILAIERSTMQTRTASLPRAVGVTNRIHADNRQVRARHLCAAAREYEGPSIVHDASLWTPTQPAIVASGTGAPGEAAATSYDNHKPQSPPPDLPSLLLDSRIVYLGMPLVR